MTRRDRVRHQSSPFTGAVVSAMQKLYPEEYADKSFDNTGLLLEAPFDACNQKRNIVLLTIDLTSAVVDEAIAQKVNVIVAYHPIIFRGIKALTLSDSQQASLLRCARAGISIYCPHTAVDAAPGGLGDWLADIVTGEYHKAHAAPEMRNAGQHPEHGNGSNPISDHSNKLSNGLQNTSHAKSLIRPEATPQSSIYSLPAYPDPMGFVRSPIEGQPPSGPGRKTHRVSHTRSVINPIKTAAGQLVPDAGMGRIVVFDEVQELSTLIDRIAEAVGSPTGFPVAIPQGVPKGVPSEDIYIKSVGVCAGSGHSVLCSSDVDLLLTGELSHHEALAATERGQCVITLFHSNSERGYLSQVMQGKLTNLLKQEWPKSCLEYETKRSNAIQLTKSLVILQEAYENVSVDVIVSKRDRDPFGMVTRKT